MGQIEEVNLRKEKRREMRATCTATEATGDWKYQVKSVVRYFWPFIKNVRVRSEGTGRGLNNCLILWSADGQH